VTSSALRYFLWIFATISFTLATVNLVYSTVLGGDWEAVTSELEPRASWRAGIVAVGLVVQPPTGAGQPDALNPEVHIEFHKTTRPTYAGFAAAMRSATGTEDLAGRLASVPSSRGGALSDHLTEAELLELAAWLATADPHIFDAWVNDDLRGWLSVPELTGWPGEFSGPVLFVYGDPEAGSLVDRDARAHNLERYPWAEVAEIPGADHQLGINDSPHRLADEIRAYLGRVA
jgi:pimeloyl-ACP methyl ester carboxylesterase